MGSHPRVIAFLLSLIQPGAGHFLLGNLRWGVAWALAVLGIALLFAMPVSPLTMAIGVMVAPLAHVASAVDTLRLTARKPSWKVVLIAWAALVVGILGVVQPLQEHYRSRHARAFTIPSGAMEPSLLVGDYIITDNSAYRARDPQRGDIVVFKYPQDERRDFIKRIIGMSGEQIRSWDGRRQWPRFDRVWRSL